MTMSMLSYRQSLDVKCMLFLVLQSHSLDLFVVMGYKNVEKLVEGMGIYQVDHTHTLDCICMVSFHTES